MIDAGKAREITKIDYGMVDRLETGICTQIERAAKAGKHEVQGWVYDRHDRKYLGDIPDAVIEELERRLDHAGYTLGWRPVPATSAVERIIKW